MYENGEIWQADASQIFPLLFYGLREYREIMQISFVLPNYSKPFNAAGTAAIF